MGIRYSNIYLEALNTHPQTHISINQTIGVTVANQPVSITIDAGGSSFQFFSSGVFALDNVGVN